MAPSPIGSRRRALLNRVWKGDAAAFAAATAAAPTRRSSIRSKASRFPTDPWTINFQTAAFMSDPSAALPYTAGLRFVVLSYAHAR